MPLVTIITPVFNRAHLIAETLVSVQNQVFRDWECIIVDDGSTDEIEQVVSKFMQNDPRFSFVKRPLSHRQGGCGARNYGLSIAKGSYVVFLDSDDLLINNTLKDRTNYLANSNIDMLISTSVAFKTTIGDDDRLWNVIKSEETNETFMIRFLKSDMPWNTNCVTWKKEFIQKIGGWNENLTAWQDWELHLRALASSPELNVIDNFPDNYFRINEVGSIGSTYKQRKYFSSVRSAILSVQQAYRDQPDLMRILQPHFKIFVLRSVVHNGFIRNYQWNSFKYLFENRFFYGLSRWEYLRYYLLELFCRSTKIKTLLLKKRYQNYLNLIKINSSHLQHKISDVSLKD
ncbi:MAG: glycosyltransferase family 2 protein [Flavobacterium sp.]|nr:MAG: glycosyltransferase family 2 protein [Flavobacterium sp.]